MLASKVDDSTSRSSVSMLLRITSDILLSAAVTTNASVNLGKPNLVKSSKTPKEVNKSNKRLMNLRRKLAMIDGEDLIAIEAAKNEIIIEKAKHRNILRRVQNETNIKRDVEAFSILSSDPFSIFRKLKVAKSNSAVQIPYLEVGDEVFNGKNVKDGFFKSIQNLKTKKDLNKEEDKAWSGINIEDDYKHILDICKNRVDLPPISIEKSTSILLKMESNVNDFYSITPQHYINGGKAGTEHFNFLLNSIIEDVNNASIEEMNSIHALLLHKGHGKSKTSDKSYRTISTCPVLSKALDLYIRDLHLHKWSAKQAPTQYQGAGSSHELAALLITEVVQHSVFTLKEPLYLLFLDARSAFDVVVPQLLIRNLYLSGIDGNTAIFLDHRLNNRLTYIEWDKSLMGPVHDNHGLEQGGSNSSDFYKLYNNDLLISTQKSKQGVKLGNDAVISSVGLADDTVLCANRLSNLFNILYLALNYCAKYKVSLCPTKTKLLKLTGKTKPNLDMELFNPIIINGKQIEFDDIAEHVGVLRSVDGNIPHIMNRISCHKKSLAATLLVGIARKHRANPTVGLRIEQLYAGPVLMSGLASLVLLESEVTLLDNHYKETVQNIQKLVSKTPRAVVFFLGGCLPFRAQLHIRQLTLFGMITRLTGDPLRDHAVHVLSHSKPSCKSWFWKIRDICLLYGLDHPLQTLTFPPTKESFKRQVKTLVTAYWQSKLSGEAASMSSLTNFHPSFMRLDRPHPIWTTAGSNPYEVNKAIQQARLLSGRYRTEGLARFWSQNKNGYCLAATECSPNEVVEDVEHILVNCIAYKDSRRSLSHLWLTDQHPLVLLLVMEALSSEPQYLVQFLVDCSVLPSVIRATQQLGPFILQKLFYLTRTWCYTIHCKRMELLGRWNMS